MKIRDIGIFTERKKTKKKVDVTRGDTAPAGVYCDPKSRGVLTLKRGTGTCGP